MGSSDGVNDVADCRSLIDMKDCCSVGFTVGSIVGSKEG